MSNEALNWAFAQDISPTARKFVLVALADCHNAKTGDCYPSYNTIAKKTNMNRKTVWSHIKALIESGYITCEQKARNNGSSNNNQYKLCFEVVTECNQPSGNTPTPPVTECNQPSGNTPPQSTVIQSEREREALTRDEFLRLINGGYQSEGFNTDEFAHLTESEIASQAEECWDRWGDNLKGRDPVIILRTWMRKGQSIGTVRKPSKAESSENARQGVREDSFANPIQPWHERIQPIVGEAVFRSWIRPLHYDGSNTLQAPSKFIADRVRERYSDEISTVLRGVEIKHEPYQPPAQEQ
jgi:hypothetical protein